MVNGAASAALTVALQGMNPLSVADRDQQGGNPEEPTGSGGLGAEKVPSQGELRRNWKLSEPSENGGYVVQRVHSEIEIDDADGNVVYRQSRDYSEAWKVNPGSDRTIYYGNYEADDVFAYRNLPENSFGYWTTTGSAQYYEGLTLPDSFAIGNAPMAQGLPSTIYGVTPILPENNTTPVNRAYTNFW
jgi:hypothetical protein